MSILKMTIRPQEEVCRVILKYCLSIMDMINRKTGSPTVYLKKMRIGKKKNNTRKEGVLGGAKV
jgi:hypothetical protein